MATDPEPTGPFLYGDELTTRLSAVQQASRGYDYALEEAKMTQEEAKEIMVQFKATSRKVERFRATSADLATAELTSILEANPAVKPYFSYNLFKLCKRAILEADMALLRTLVEDVELDFNQGQFKSLVTQLVVQQGWKDQ